MRGKIEISLVVILALAGFAVFSKSARAPTGAPLVAKAAAAARRGRPGVSSVAEEEDCRMIRRGERKRPAGRCPGKVRQSGAASALHEGEAGEFLEGENVHRWMQR